MQDNGRYDGSKLEFCARLSDNYDNVLTDYKNGVSNVPVFKL